MIHLQNQHLSAAINPDGAELKSLKNQQTGFEYIWQADPVFWNRSAPVLFPIVGEVKGGTYRVNGTEYKLGRHGFARDSVFTVTRQTETEAVFTLTSDENTLKIYPYKFRFSVGYRLEGKSLITTFTVENTGETSLNFSVGAHPGFNLPTKNMEDYFIEFEKTETLGRHLLKDNLFSGETEPVVNNSTVLPLSTALFDKDAIVFKKMASTKMSLKSKTGDYNLTMNYDGFPYFGIWTKPNCNEFLCLEPWCGLADNAGFEGDFSHKEGVNNLPAKAIFERSFTIEIL